MIAHRPAAARALRAHHAMLAQRSLASKPMPQAKPPKNAITPAPIPVSPTPAPTSQSQLQPEPTKIQGPTEPYEHRKPPRPEKTWLAKWLENWPAGQQAFFVFANFLGYSSPKQIAGRNALVMYENFCALQEHEESAFWHDECRLPRTFQSWFTITNLHVWLLTVRLRALPPPHGTLFVQALLDHFFLDIEERVRAVLQPQSQSVSAALSSLAPSRSAERSRALIQESEYARHEAEVREKRQKEQQEQAQVKADPTSTAVPTPHPQPIPKPKGAVSERLVSRQMRIFREQWMGMQMAFDLGLVGWGETNADVEMAAAVWRNLLGARGANGIALELPVRKGAKGAAATSKGGPAPGVGVDEGWDEANASSIPASPSASNPNPIGFRRSINLVGSDVEPLKPILTRPGGLAAAEATDDGSGVSDFPPALSHLYVAYPELMHAVVAYVRRELVRLEGVTDEEVVLASGKMRFARVRPVEDGKAGSGEKAGKKGAGKGE